MNVGSENRNRQRALPNEDGFWLIRQVRINFSILHLPAIAVTSHSREFNEIQAIESGFQWFIAKPIDPNELVQAVTQLTNNSHEV